MPKLYDELSGLVSAALTTGGVCGGGGIYARTLEAASDAPVHSVLELGAVAATMPSHLKRRFNMVLVEPSAGMRALSCRLNPECEHVDGDMRSVRLAREFDAVFVHDAVCYMTTEADLRMAMQTAFVHCRAGGVALFAPDFVRETFRPSTDHGGSDEELRGLRYLEWKWDPDPSDSTAVDYAYRCAGPREQCEHDRHVEGCSRAATGSGSSTASASRRAAYCSSIRKSSPGPTKSSWRRRREPAADVSEARGRLIEHLTDEDGRERRRLQCSRDLASGSRRHRSRPFGEISRRTSPPMPRPFKLRVSATYQCWCFRSFR